MLGLHLVAHRPHRRAFAHDFQRDTLADFTLRTTIFDQRLDAPTEHIDETGRDGQAADVNFLLPLRIAQVAHRRDGVALYSDIAPVGRVSTSVIDCAVA